MMGMCDRLLELSPQSPITPSFSCQSLVGASGSSIASVDYTVRSFPVGHIGMYVSSKVQRNLPPTLVDWLKART